MRFIILIYICSLTLFTSIDAFPKVPLAYKHNIETDTLLADGLNYKKILVGNQKTKFAVHVLEVNLLNHLLVPTVLKAGSHTLELAKLHDIITHTDSITEGKILGAINGSFWKAYTNNPIGACFIDGEIVELNPYKEWSGIYFDSLGKPFIDNYKITGKIRLKNGNEIILNRVNRRRDSLEIVLYNKYSGVEVPYVSKGKIDDEIATRMAVAMNELFENDSTEFDIDPEILRDELINEKRSNSLENSLIKCKLKYLSNPAVNKSIKCVVVAIDTGVIAIDTMSAVLSYGINIPYDMFPTLGDTLTLSYNTDVQTKVEFRNGITATPRLVRDGKAQHEALREGSKGRRFINSALSRTAVGYSKDKTKLYLVTVQTTSRSNFVKGANLKDMAMIMKSLGCHNAMNLDGGGSTVMVIDGKNVMSTIRPDASRRISVGLGVRQLP
ncbi:MAG: phosphodiester glycosidase family protein [Desulfobulbaceae bacterium]|nr:phosphodiester glycosidase family protein [Candidatus Kapabacteria bacterium]MBS3999982.1 phosphodiester glycosidase family protein [Desulfobulbaceae bacterium]